MIRRRCTRFTHPVRLAVLEVLREPDSAARVARRLGQPREAVNYHVEELGRAGLVRPAGERRKRTPGRARGSR
jgi:DNA-binding transcriptional ArsR family regulator